MVALLMLSACSDAQSTLTAVEFVEKSGVGNNLTQLSARAALGTQTYRMIVAEVGEKEANQLLKELIKITTTKYQSEWNQKLAEAYLQHFSIEELNSVYYEKGKSEYARKMLSKRGDVGETMQEKSKGLLNTIVTEILTSIFKRVQ